MLRVQPLDVCKQRNNNAHNELRKKQRDDHHVGDEEEASSLCRSVRGSIPSINQSSVHEFHIISTHDRRPSLSREAAEERAK